MMDYDDRAHEGRSHPDAADDAHLTQQRSRLISIIDFAEQSVRLRSKPPTTVAAQALFELREDELEGLPGVRVNTSSPDGEDEVWLSVDRLHEIKPPQATDTLLRAWLVISDRDLQEPRLRESVGLRSLIALGLASASADGTEDAAVTLNDFEAELEVRARFAKYLSQRWRPWAEEEARRRKTIRLYSQLFTLKQKLEGSIVDAPLELVWGVGLGIWKCSGTHLSYPLIGQLVELSLNNDTAQIEVRPQDADARIEIDWYASADNPGVAPFEQAAKKFFADSSTTFSPFDRGTFEPLLRTAATHLDSNGVYWPDHVPAEDRKPPAAVDRLRVTDTWILFARPRTNNVFLQDLEKLKKCVEEASAYPAAVAAVVTEPADSNPELSLPEFRGMSASYHGQGDAGGGSRDLFFPKPFNEEQVRIVQLLEISDGVVVQGPPGTGKTHTIANVICHYLAEGKRVLVTSMKDPALAVLQEQLPSDVRPLAIALLTSEAQGMKQFEHAIQKIASEVQSLDRASTARAIGHLEDRIDGLHAKLAATDREIAEWGKKNVSKIVIDGEELDPRDAALVVATAEDSFGCLPDDLDVSPEFRPLITDADVLALREARRELRQDIDYLQAILPQLSEFPDAAELLRLHEDLCQFDRLKKAVDGGEVPALAETTSEMITRARDLLSNVELLRNRRQEVVDAERSWATSIRSRLRTGADEHLLSMLEDLGDELGKAAAERKVFFERPVSTPADAEVDRAFIDAVQNLSAGKMPFGFAGLIGRTTEKQQLRSVRVLGAPPSDSEAWAHVGSYLQLLKRLRALAVRWNAVASELQMDLVNANQAEGALVAERWYTLYLRIKAIVELEQRVATAASAAFPRWVNAKNVIEDERELSQLEKYLRHHLTKSRLENVWVQKTRIQGALNGRSGRVVDQIRSFFSDHMGRPQVESQVLQDEWTRLTAELVRVTGLASLLETVKDVCERVEASGAPQYSSLLMQPCQGTVDVLLPDNWREIWRARRLSTHLKAIDGHEALKQLGKRREDMMRDLARSYGEVVGKRTWLKLSENASPRIRAALAAYLTAIQKIGKGMGKRAVRYRHDARMAASQANAAIPCWIMPHYRVSESLPPALGSFDLLVIDEASQSDLTALPSLLRAKKILVVGDDKQVSPEGVGLDDDRVGRLMQRFLADQVEEFRPQLSPTRSIYDLFKVVFASSSVMLKEHFRCVAPIIEYSKREFYNHELRPLRVPKNSERLDPPLIDVLVEDGFRDGDVNKPEAEFILSEISSIVSDPKMVSRSIGVVSLLADKQALLIWERLTEKLGPEIMQRHSIACGDARTFQGKERDIMFLSMISGPNNVGIALTRDTFAQRFNVAGSRAKNRMYLVRSVGLENLSAADRLRRNLISHFDAPFAQDERRVEDLRSLCESDFERDVYDLLCGRGFLVRPQVRVGQFRIDMVVEGNNDTRLAVECDGDRYHGPEKWIADMDRQRVLERAGWSFWRCFASTFTRRRSEMVDDLLQTLAERGIEPVGADGARQSVHTEHRRVSTLSDERQPAEPIEAASERQDAKEEDTANAGANTQPKENERSADIESDQPTSAAEKPLRLPGPERIDVIRANSPKSSLQTIDYCEYSGPAGADPYSAGLEKVSEGLLRIVEAEGPIVAKRAYDVFLRSCGIRRMGRDLRSIMNRAASYAIRKDQLVSEQESGVSGVLYSVLRINGTPPVRLRTRGSRSLEEIPPSELQVVARYVAERDGVSIGSAEHLRAVLGFFDLVRLTTQVEARLTDILGRSFPYVDEYLRSVEGNHEVQA